MPTTFPTTLDSFSNKRVIDLEDAVEAVEAKVGVNGSAVTSSLDFRISALESAPDASAPLVLSTGSDVTPLSLDRVLSTATKDLFQVIGQERAGPGDDSAGRYRVIVDKFGGIQTNAALTISTGLWTGVGKTIPPVLAQSRPYCIGADSDVIGPTLYLKGNGNAASSHVEIQDISDNKVLEITQPGTVNSGAWMSIGAEDPIATLTLDDRYEEPAGGAKVSFVMRNGRGTGSPSSIRFKMPSSGEFDISANSESGENALSEWAVRFGHGTQGVSFQTASAPGGTRTEMGRFISSGLLLKAPTATAGTPDRTSPTLTFQDTYWSGSASVTRGYRVKDVALGSGPHALQFIVDETSLVALALGYTGQVGIGDPFVTSPSSTGQLHVVAAAAGNPAIVADSAATPTADIQQWRIGSTMASRIGKGGRFITNVATAPALGDLVDGETAISRNAGGDLIITSRVSGALKTATVTVA